MMTKDLSIEFYRQRRRVLGRRADTRLSDALRRPAPFPRRLARRVLRALSSRSHVIRRWQDGAFVAHRVGPARAA
ncbi:MAG: hypothetical protein KDK10_17890 [Maritimibacter sp.]|nr:hypothetical protein [Maritimibacter sp.]